jgi:hypothetical protein
MSKFNESAIEALAIQHFERLGYSSIHLSDMAPNVNQANSEHLGGGGVLSGMSRITIPA